MTYHNTSTILAKASLRLIDTLKVGVRHLLVAAFTCDRHTRQRGPTYLLKLGRRGKHRASEQSRRVGGEGVVGGEGSPRRSSPQALAPSFAGLPLSLGRF